MVQTPDGSLFAAGQFGLYRNDGKGWESTSLKLSKHERISDLVLKEDTMVVVGRSYLYTSVSPYNEFSRMELKAPEGYDGKVSLFRTIWLMHSGEMFGTVGKLIMDAVAVILIVLCLTGIAYWLLPKYIRRIRRRGKTAKGSTQLMKSSINWHDKLGRYTFVILMFVSFTGWCLRPPVLIALVSFRTSAIPYTVADSDNAWNDRLRMLRYDAEYGDWLLSSSEGIFSLATLRSVPVKLEKTPPVSVMGLNVWQKDSCGNWLTGSFSGMYVWDRSRQVSTDYFTGEKAEDVAGPPFGKYAVSGYCDNIGEKPFVVEYYNGTSALHMPENLYICPKIFLLCLCRYGTLRRRYIRDVYTPSSEKELLSISSLPDWQRCGASIQVSSSEGKSVSDKCFTGICICFSHKFRKISNGIRISLELYYNYVHYAFTACSVNVH